MCSEEDLLSLDSHVEELIFDYGVLSDPSFTQLNLTRFVNVKRIVTGEYSLTCVKDLFLIGMHELESVVIGKRNFLADGYRNGYGVYVSDCPKLRELRTGDHSFSEYRIIEIEDLDALEVIDIGYKGFYYASLELKSGITYDE